MVMANPSLDLKILYCRDLKAFNFFQKLSIYTTVSLQTNDPNNKLSETQQQLQRTPTDKEGDDNPEWKHQVHFDLSGIIPDRCDDIFLRFDIYHEGQMFGDKHIGEVHVPLRDFVEQGDGIMRIVSYQVKGLDNKPNGVLTFSYRVTGVGNLAAEDGGISGYPVIHHEHHQNHEESNDPEIPNSQNPISYPSVGLDDNSIGTFPAPQHVQSQEIGHGIEYPNYESFYRPPSQPEGYGSYYPAPPPPPPPPGPPPPPPPLHPMMSHHHHHRHHAPYGAYYGPRPHMRDWEHRGGWWDGYGSNWNGR